MRVRVASLFSGVGGLDLGVERGLYAAGVQADTVFQCEADPFGRSVLRRHWPAAEVCEDVRSIKELPPCELLIAGFPCQGISTAGKGRGLEDERSALFFEIVRLLRVAGSSIPYVLLENTPAINSRGLDRVLWELAGLGYNARWGVISAGSLGFGHRRRRWFLVGWLANDDRERFARGARMATGSRSDLSDPDRGDGCGSSMADTRRGSLQLCRKSGKLRRSGFQPQTNKGGQWKRKRESAVCGSQAVADSHSRRQESRRHVAGVGGYSQSSQANRSQAGAGPLVAGLGDPADGVPSWVARCRRPVAAPGRPQFSYEPPRTKQREQGDKQRLKSLGNSVVPGQAAAVSYWLGLLMRGVV